jgi:hypothetical protein
MASKVSQSVADTGNVVLNLLVYALIIGSIVGLSTFTALTVLNVTVLTSQLVIFFGAIVGFVGLVGTFVGIRWLISAIKGSGKNDSITNISA